MPREQVPWFPALDETLCDGCIKCLEFCSHHVYARREDGVVYVAEPYDCVVGCDECARLCKRRAITFPPRLSLMLLAHQQ
jgi:NAD-dependent dihydropyrimidine dehydrogenase PreA subunit